MTTPAKSDNVRQSQFLTIVSREEAAEKFSAAIDFGRIDHEDIPLSEAVGRVLAGNITSPIDVTAFDRSNVDGFAVIASDTYGASEDEPVVLSLNDERIPPGVEPTEHVRSGTCTPIATGGMIPRGADAVVMIEETDPLPSTDAHSREQVRLRRAATPGQFITFAGTDIASGEQVLVRGTLLTAREVGVLAALGMTTVAVRKQPRVAILSTGDEIVAPGERLPVGSVYDSNQTILAASVAELGCEPVPLGIVPDDPVRMREQIEAGLQADALILSGGTSKGAGDLSYRVIAELTTPGVLAHGVALKPGKPVCLAAHEGKPVVILPGFPTSAIFTFHEFVAHVLRQLAGHPRRTRSRVQARVPVRINSARGRAEYVLVTLTRSEEGFAAYPLGRGSGSVTTFSLADGFLTVGEQEEYLDPNTEVEVELLADDLPPADLVCVGSHCAGVDLLATRLAERGVRMKLLRVGSRGGVTALKHHECDVATLHLYDEQTGTYNRPFLPDDAEIIGGYARTQGVVFRKDDSSEPSADGTVLIERFAADDTLRMVNRNRGSGTRVLIDRHLGGRKPAGYAVEPTSHNAVCAAVVQGRADWGVAVETVAAQYGLDFAPLSEERFEFAVSRERRESPAVQALIDLLTEAQTRAELLSLGLRTDAP